MTKEQLKIKKEVNMKNGNKPITTIKYICEFFGIGQTELAKKYDIPLRTVQDWYAERRTPPTYVVNMILELLLREHNEKERLNNTDERE